MPRDLPTAVTDEQDAFGSEGESPHRENSYGQLLLALNRQSHGGATAKKKRKLGNGAGQPTNASLSGNGSFPIAATDQKTNDALNERTSDKESDLDVEEENDDDEEQGELDVFEGEMNEEDQKDPFESHFANPGSIRLAVALKSVKDQKWSINSSSTQEGLKKQYSVPNTGNGKLHEPPRICLLDNARLKRRLLEAGRKSFDTLTTTEREIAGPVFSYQDMLFALRTIDNSAHLRDLTMLHALNHVFKTRDRVIKNNAKLAHEQTGDLPELRDQGFTRPKVLIILPTRQACAKFVDSIVTLSEPEQQENKSRFLEGYAGSDDQSFEDKPLDFQELFGGNDDDMFRIGLKFTRKTVKFFSSFYNSDVILASPLGLRTAIETGGAKDGKKGHDADFLSSIEIVIVDHANALLMQNWQHVEYILSQLNLLPRESHGCDFSRVRHWYLDGQSKYLRQTIILTDFVTPEINSIFTKSMLNVAGKFKYTPVYNGAMTDVSTSLPISTTQTFMRLNSLNPTSDGDVRFQYFTSSVLPTLLKSKQEKGTLIFVSSYLDFVRLSNHFSTSTTTASLSFGAISEYTSVRDVARARSHFLTGRHSVLLYSERAHHFRRYKLRGVQRVVFYSLPENPIFWREMVCMLAQDFDTEQGQDVRSVRACFSRWDVLKLERIVGTSRVGRMVSDRTGDTFEFT
jgi:U3 small nucleolar RNA-associated protein 25